MGVIGSITSSSTVPDDLAKRLGPAGVHEILLMLWDAYHDLAAELTVKIDENSKEDYITQEWFGRIALRWRSRNRALALKTTQVEPIHQYQDCTLRKNRGKAPTIDFCFRDWGTKNSYFGVESKNLYQQSKSHIDRYVNTGVKNYTQGRYGSQSSESSIAGYVLSGSTLDIVAQLSDAIARTGPVSNLKRETKYADPQYISSHTRIPDGATIVLHHLFLDFTNCPSKSVRAQTKGTGSESS